ncbi:MAG: hypothetical protein RSD85_00095 [Erysipelotrichaceae bacterium]
MIFNSPKNFKRGQYILGRYRKTDIIILISTTIISILAIVSFLSAFKLSLIVNALIVLILLLPMVTVYILFMPLPIYLNVLELLKAYLFYSSKQKRFKWEGIYISDNEERIITDEEEK